MLVNRVVIEMMNLAAENFHRLYIYNTAATVLQVAINRLALFTVFGRQSQNAGRTGR